MTSEERWLRLTASFATSPVLEEALSDCLIVAGAGSIVSQDETTMDGADCPPGIQKLVTYFDANDANNVSDTRSALLAIARQLEADVDVQIDLYDDTSWRDGWKAFFVPAQVSPRLAVRAPWCELAVDPGVHVLVIEPGAAFGTGLHETTKLCLQAIDRHVGDHAERIDGILDVGCGSGVLAIAARMLGVRRAVGLDIDPIAAKVSDDNAVINGVDGCLFSVTPIAQLPGVFELIVCNMLSSRMMPIVDAILDRTAEGGHIILSGLQTFEVTAMSQRFTADHRCKVVRTDELGEWSSVELSR
ncbi:MAG: hypothetical protein AUK47_24790 [Deltaproteobacteria bacterium CG2_30_63_29]|nr:MAG: hypothetical protein AUK47_24790 [Deltaproteobacteria bacterium CG2_30_63_29]PJB33967.1 MAG: hypothetical protein CO108_29660 [Deltaproteobacteria bacterium CG_4_9_14_3_um_filter_63_12]